MNDVERYRPINLNPKSPAKTTHSADLVLQGFTNPAISAISLQSTVLGRLIVWLSVSEENIANETGWQVAKCLHKT